MNTVTVGAACPQATGFEAPIEITSSLPNTLRVLGADIDSDGFTDIVTLSGEPAQLYWHRNQTFVAPLNYSRPASLLDGLAEADSFYVGDLSSDGRVDIVVVSTTLNEVGLHLGAGLDSDGTPTFSPPELLVNGSLGSDVRVGPRLRAADLDGDGDIELVREVFAPRPAQVHVAAAHDLGTNAAPLPLRLELFPAPELGHVAGRRVGEEEGVGTQRIERAASGYEVTFGPRESGKEETTVSCDLVVLGLGREAPDQRYEADVQSIPAVVFTVPHLARVGLSEKDARERYPKMVVRSGDRSSSGNVSKRGETHARYRILIDEESDRVVGAHLLGPGADDFINIIALAMQCDLSVTRLKKGVFAFPTFASELAACLS